MENPIINGIFVFVLGLLVVFLGMTIIILAVSACGKILSANSEKPKKVKEQVKVENPVVEETSESSEIPTHIKAAIVAAITAYYFESQSKCDFIVKKIRRF